MVQANTVPIPKYWFFLANLCTKKTDYTKIRMVQEKSIPQIYAKVIR